MSRPHNTTPYQKISHTITKRIRDQPPALVSDMAWLVKDKEEAFCILVADGLPLAIAFKRAGFDAKDKACSALQLYKAQRIQERISAIIKHRAATPPVSLPEITDMMKRVYAGSIHDCEYTPAYNAAFGLARLYGLVVDRAQLDVVRRPSREPDAPSEMALGQWIEGLPGAGKQLSEQPLPAHIPPPIGPGPSTIEATTFGNDLDPDRDTTVEQNANSPTISTPSIPLVRELRGEQSAVEGGGEIGNGAPGEPVTGTPYRGAHPGIKSTRVDLGEGTGPGAGFPKIEDLF